MHVEARLEQAGNDAPQRAAGNRRIVVSIRSNGFGTSTRSPTTVASTPPISTWPGVPMLNKPVRNAKATDNPVRMSGVAVASVLPMRSRFISPPLKRNS